MMFTMTNLKTSTKISLKFTFFTSLILVLFWVIVNFFYFTQWYWQEKARLEERWTFFETFWFWNRLWVNPIENLRLNAAISETLIENSILWDIAILDWEYYVFSILENQVLYTKVSHHIYAQFSLFLITLYVIILFILLSYIFSFYFVKSSLKNLNYLVWKTKNLDLEHLNTNIHIDWPKDDEIKILADTISNSMKKLNKQAKSLREFISNASHELKTPLMEISSQLDLVDDYEVKDNLKTSVKNMNNIVENLLILARIQSQSNFIYEEVDISFTVQNIANRIHKLYEGKSINLDLKITEWVKKHTSLSLFEMLFKNLLENSFKYTNNWWNIIVELDNNYLKIQDDWIWIKDKNLSKIWESFYQEDLSKNDSQSFGLWLYIVKQIIDVLWYDIDVKSQEWKWTRFTLYFN